MSGAALTLLALLGPASAWAQDQVTAPADPPPSGDAPAADPLAATEDTSVAADLDALKERVRALERQLDEANRAAASTEASEIPLDLETKVHGYAAANAIIYEDHPLGLFLEQFVLGYSANLDKKYVFSSEISYDPGEITTPLTLDALEVRLAFRDTFQVVVGRSTAPYSEWADTRLHGAYRYTPVVLPEVLNLEGETGLIPMHLLGVQVRGVVPVGYWQLGYVGEVSNGRSPLFAGVAQMGDSGWGKAVLGRVWVETPNGVRLGVAGSYDLVDPMEDAPGEVVVVNPTTEGIGAVSVSHHGSRLELLSEGFAILHQEEGADPFLNYAAYGLVGYRMKKTTPYLMVDSKSLDPKDPIYKHLEEVADEVKGTLGVRYDLGLRVALKGQADFVVEQIYTGPDKSPDPVISPGFDLQLAAGF